MKKAIIYMKCETNIINKYADHSSRHTPLLNVTGDALFRGIISLLMVPLLIFLHSRAEAI
jgi:hypothetical protein